MLRFCTIVFAGALLVSCNARQTNSERGENAPGGASAGAMAPTGPISGHIQPQGPVVSYADTVDRVAPAVVTVHATMRTRAPQQYNFFQGDPFFNWFFGGGNPQRFGGRGGGGPMQIEQALGSGVIVREDGYILTNDHVIDGAQQISVDFIDRRNFKARVIGADKPSDLAVLKIEAKNLPVLTLGNSDQVRVGDVCLAVGNPLGIGESVTAGIISAKGRQTDLSDGAFEDFLQTDAAINRGNSGGALVNTRGELIGINSQILSPNGGGNIGIGFAIPSNMAKTVMNQLIEHGKVSRGQLGVTVQYLNDTLAESLGLKNVHGVLVSGVRPGSAAERAGIKQGDVILAMNGKAINDVNGLRNSVASAGAGSKVTVTILRNGNRQDVPVTLGSFNPNEAPQTEGQGGGNNNNGASNGKLGIQVEPLTPDIARQIGDPPNTQGLVVSSVDPTGAAAQAGIQPGDVILEVNHQRVRNGGDIGSALAKSGKRPALLQVMRGGQTLFVAVAQS